MSFFSIRIGWWSNKLHFMSCASQESACQTATTTDRKRKTGGVTSFASWNLEGNVIWGLIKGSSWSGHGKLKVDHRWERCFQMQGDYGKVWPWRSSSSYSGRPRHTQAVLKSLCLLISSCSPACGPASRCSWCWTTWSSSGRRAVCPTCSSLWSLSCWSCWMQTGLSRFVLFG